MVALMITLDPLESTRRYQAWYQKQQETIYAIYPRWGKNRKPDGIMKVWYTPFSSSLNRIYEKWKWAREKQDIRDQGLYGGGNDSRHYLHSL